jgi:phosphatidylinositol glycan class S
VADIVLTSHDLDPIFSSFSAQLLALLDVPKLPEGLHILEEKAIITDWQLDALLRRRTLKNARGAQDTLSSIVKLVDQISNMPVGQRVKTDVQDTLAALEKVCFMITPLHPADEFL